MSDTTLAVSGLHVAINHVPILRNVSVCLERGRILGMVGESGGGKTMVGKAVLDVLPAAAHITAGSILFEGRDLLNMSSRERRALSGNSIAMILQNPMTALNPVFRVGRQMTDVMRFHLKLGEREANARALSLLESMHIRDPERVMRLYPHELSGGMCQRVVISIAFSCEPRLIIADEPTTALDVTVQHQILRLLKMMQLKVNAAVLFITHDLGVVAKLCDDVAVLYGGMVLETGRATELFGNPRHEYTRALIAAAPRYDRPDMALRAMPQALHLALAEQARAYDKARTDA